MKQLAKIGLLLCAITLMGAPAYAVSLGTAGDYAAFVFGDFVGQNSDVEGRLAAGGKVQLQNYGIGTNLPATTAKSSLVVGGNLTYTNGQINHGDAVVGGSATTTGVNVADGVLKSNAAIPINFAAEQTFLTDLSLTLSKKAANGTVESKWGGLYLKGNGTSALQVFNIDGATLLNTNTFKFDNNVANIAQNATLLFNISGTSTGMRNFDMREFTEALGDSWDNVLFNFYEATELKFSGIGVKGSVLAPLADASGDYGNIDGQFIAKSWNGTTEFHGKPFDGDTPNTPVPEPGTIALLGFGLLGLAFRARKMRK